MNWEKLLNGDRIEKSKREKEGDARNEFESDFGRTIFSPAIRRMHDKTQVFPLTSDDNIHSRLTHSMEVMSIGHSLGIRICEHPKFKDVLEERDLFREIPVILKNACLVHDIGNPSFGHFGESVIQNYFKQFFENQKKEENEEKYKIKAGQLDASEARKFIKLTSQQEEDFTKFDGNAQGFRVLTKLQVLDTLAGLNLTYATLGAYLKYPNADIINEDIISKKKRGVFQSEKEYLTKVIEECGLMINGEISRHPLCYLMEAADSICYLVMDIEDGFNSGLYDYDFIVDYFKDIKPVSILIEKCKEYKSDTSRMVQFRIGVIRILVDLAVQNFIDNIDLIYKGEYNEELIKDDDEYKFAKRLGDFSLEIIFPSRDITSLELTGHSVLSGLLDYYTTFIFHEDKAYRKRAQSLISKSVLKVAFLENGLPENSKIDKLNDYFKLRVIVDFISGMTDQFALKHYQELSGQKIK
jgi:dGTPase